MVKNKSLTYNNKLQSSFGNINSELLDSKQNI